MTPLNPVPPHGDFDGLAPLGDTSLWIRRRGHGPLLLTVHGGLGFDHTSFVPWLDPLAAGHTLVHADLRGNGRSPRPAPDAWAAIDHATWVADLDRLRASLGHDRLVLLGHSYGAFLALDYALAHPDRLAGLILCGAAPSFTHVDRVAANAVARGGDLGVAFLQALAAPIPDDATFATLFPPFLPLYFHEPARARGFFADTRFSAAALNRSLGQLVATWDVTARLPEITAPTLVLVGDDDFITPRDPCADRLLAGLPRASLAVLPGAGHFPFAETPEPFLAAVDAFLATLAP